MNHFHLKLNRQRYFLNFHHIAITPLLERKLWQQWWWTKKFFFFRNNLVTGGRNFMLFHFFYHFNCIQLNMTCQKRRRKKKVSSVVSCGMMRNAVEKKCGYIAAFAFFFKTQKKKIVNKFFWYLVQFVFDFGFFFFCFTLQLK